MRAHKLGILSAATASLCCVGPVLLAVLGVGGLGAGAFVGEHHWYFIAGAALLLGLSWYAYLKERRRCQTERCEMAGGKLTRITLPLATLMVIAFFGLNLYTYAGDERLVPSLASAAYAQTVIPVEGMTCFSCEMHVEHSLKKLEGVGEVKASAPNHSVTVSYDPARIAVEKLVEAVNQTGYRAQLPEKNQS